MIKIKTKELKDILSKLNVAIEKNVFNPQSGWVQIKIGKDGEVELKVSNFDYYVKSSFNTENTEEEEIIATVEAGTFIPLVAKLSNEYTKIYRDDKSLILETENNLYTFPLQINLTTGEVADITEIHFDCSNYSSSTLSGEEVVSIATITAKGINDNSSCKKIYQHFVYVDNFGAEAFMDNIYVNEFKCNEEEFKELGFKILLSKTQSKILSIFDGVDEINIKVEDTDNDEAKRRVEFSADNIVVVFITQPMSIVKQFPSEKLRNIAKETSKTHVTIDREELNKALARLMVFDKKFGANVLDYSKIEWGKDSCKLVSVKSKNYEIIPYIKKEGTYEHESIIRFADLVEQLKAFTSKEIDMSYGESPVIVINAEELKQLIPEIVKK